MNELREKYGKRRVELWSIGCGLCFCAVMAAMSLIPPLLAPGSEMFMESTAMVAGMLLLALLLSTLGFLLLTLAVRSWRGLMAAAILWLGFSGLKLVYPYEEKLWENHFAKTAALREQLLVMAKAASADKERTRIDLPASLLKISDQRWASTFRDDRGRLFIGYTVWRQGIDNCVGFMWSESGVAPPRMAYPEITWSKPLGGGWFLFRST